MNKFGKYNTIFVAFPAECNEKLIKEVSFIEYLESQKKNLKKNIDGWCGAVSIQVKSSLIFNMDIETPRYGYLISLIDKSDYYDWTYLHDIIKEVIIGRDPFEVEEVYTSTDRAYISLKFE